jgi:catechol 2,3-dioxygenase-like lactoylglutathione lyase family enzyme
VEINGIAHIFITARDFDRCRKFYGELLPYLGLTCVADVPGSVYYCVGGRTGFGVQSPSAKADARFVQGMPGLHHVCFRARERTDIDSAHEYLTTIGAVIVHPPREDQFAPGYYSVLFEDPDGIRLEINHVPGVGLFQPGTKIGAPYGG